MSIFEVKSNYEGINLTAFEQLLASGALYRKFFIGVSELEQDFLYRCPKDYPGVICIGAQGSGKTTTALGIIRILNVSSMKNLFIQFIDTSSKAAADYSEFFSKENVATCLSDKRKLIASINLAYSELMARSESYRTLGSFENYLSIKKKFEIPTPIKAPGHIYDYEKMLEDYINKYNQILQSKDQSEEDKIFLQWIYDKNPLRLKRDKKESLLKYIKGDKSQINSASWTEEIPKEALYIMVFEEFHNIVASEEVNFLDKKDEEGTLAYKLKQIARTGRSFGMSVFILSQRATYSEIPQDLKAGVQNPFIHKLGATSDANSFNVPELNMDDLVIKGRIATELGMIHFPFITEETNKRWEKQYYQPFQDTLHYKSAYETRKILGGDGADGIVDNSPLSDVMANFDLFDTNRIAKRFLESFGFHKDETFVSSEEIKDSYIKNGEAYPLICFKKSGKSRGYSSGIKISGSHLKLVKKKLELLKMNNPIIFVFGDVPSELKGFSDYIINLDEMNYMANILDSREEKEIEGTYLSYAQDCVLFKVGESEDELSDIKDKKSAEDKLREDLEWLSEFNE